MKMPGPESTFRDRLLYVQQRRGFVDHTVWAQNAGLSKDAIGLRLRGDRGDSPRRETVLKIARYSNASMAWLFSGVGHWEPYEGDAAMGTPPEKVATKKPLSGKRVRTPVERPDIEPVTAWFYEPLKALIKPPYTDRHEKAVTRLLMVDSALVEEEGPDTLLKSALEVAYDLDRQGQAMTPANMLRLLLVRNASKPQPVARESPRDRHLAESDKRVAGRVAPFNLKPVSKDEGEGDK